jgi:hypothetical protein
MSKQCFEDSLVQMNDGSMASVLTNDFKSWLFLVFAYGPEQYIKADVSKQKEMEDAFLANTPPYEYSAIVSHNIHNNQYEWEQYGF